MTSPKKPEKLKPVDQPAETPEGNAAGYKVGYRRPPKYTQFKKGQSGNPKGRRPNSQNLKTIMEKTSFELIKVTANGKPRRLPAIEAAMRSLQTRALKGDGKALELWLRLAKLVGCIGPQNENPDQEGHPAENDKVLLEELRRMLQSDEAVGISLDVNADDAEEDGS
jgi:hypothetical protein